MWELLLELLVIGYYMGMRGSNYVLDVFSKCSCCSGILWAWELGRGDFTWLNGDRKGFKSNLTEFADSNKLNDINRAVNKIVKGQNVSCRSYYSGYLGISRVHCLQRVGEIKSGPRLGTYQ